MMGDCVGGKDTTEADGSEASIGRHRSVRCSVARRVFPVKVIGNRKMERGQEGRDIGSGSYNIQVTRT